MSNGKTRGDSYTVMTELVLPNDTNLLGNLLGGRLLHLIDISGALAASRHSEGLVATVLMEAVEFKRPIKLGSIVTLISYPVWSGNTSLETCVEVYSEKPGAACKEFVNKVNIVFVALDASGKKRKVIPYLPVTEREKEEYERAAERKNRRKDEQGNTGSV